MKCDDEIDFLRIEAVPKDGGAGDSAVVPVRESSRMVIDDPEKRVHISIQVEYKS